jgi:NADPH-dependent 7-cyano-7-deazaguanine reductase QueF
MCRTNICRYLATLKPEKLMVYATYTRRGGLDINPCRVSDLSWMPSQFAWHDNKTNKFDIEDVLQ